MEYNFSWSTLEFLGIGEYCQAFPNLFGFRKWSRFLKLRVCHGLLVVASLLSSSKGRKTMVLALSLWKEVKKGRLMEDQETAASCPLHLISSHKSQFLQQP